MSGSVSPAAGDPPNGSILPRSARSDALIPIQRHHSATTASLPTLAETRTRYTPIHGRTRP